MNERFNHPLSEPTPNITNEPLVQHSGKAGYEKPVTDFDNTSLQEALDRGLVIIPEDTSTLYEGKPKSYRLAIVLAGAAAALAGAVGLIVAGGGGAGTETDGTHPVPTTAVSPGTSMPEQTTATTNEVKSFEAQHDTSINGYAKAHGLLDITSINPNEKFITAVKNGREFKVPYLRDPQEPRAFAESALALWMCYLTTGNEECIATFSDDATVQTSLRNQRATDFAPYISRPGNEQAQAAVIDTTEDPASFDFSPESNSVIELRAGKLQFGISKNDPFWQDLAQQTQELLYQFKDLKFQVGSRIDGNGDTIPNVTELTWSLK